MADEEAVEVAAEAPVVELDIISALKQVLRKALVNDGLRRGLHESVKALDRGTGKLCVLSESCDNEEYTRLVEALCSESGIPLLKATDGATLGEWVGLAKLDAEGKIKKAVRTSVVVVTDFGEETAALNFVLEYVKSQQ